ncbi:unnamed protein product [Sympodiomycopsis kandeliae]
MTSIASHSLYSYLHKGVQLMLLPSLRASARTTVPLLCLAASSGSVSARNLQSPVLPLNSASSIGNSFINPISLPSSLRTYAMGSNSSTAANFPKGKTDEQWRAQLSKEQFRVLRQQGTEMAGSGKYDSHYPSDGVYTCAGCDSPLYKANTKFKSGCGWPAFFDAIPGAIDRHVDSTFGMKRIEITCKACGGHLGHVFEGEGFQTPTDERHCVNSVSLNFSPEDKPAS